MDIRDILSQRPDPAPSTSTTRPSTATSATAVDTQSTAADSVAISHPSYSALTSDAERRKTQPKTETQLIDQSSSARMSNLPTSIAISDLPSLRETLFSQSPAQSAAPSPSSSLTTSSSTHASSRRRSSNRLGRFRLEIRQHPTDGLAFGDDDASVRNSRAVPLDPPIVCELIPETANDSSLLSLPELSLRARLTDVTGQVIGQTPNGLAPLLGDCTQSAFVAQVFPPREQSYFIFPEIAVRMTGSFRLRFDILDRTGLSFHHVGSVFTDVFRVTGKREYPGQSYSSELVQAIARRGLKIKTKIPKSPIDHRKEQTKGYQSMSSQGTHSFEYPGGSSPVAAGPSSPYARFSNTADAMAASHLARSRIHTIQGFPRKDSKSADRPRPPIPHRSSTFNGTSGLDGSTTPQSVFPTSYHPSDRAPPPFFPQRLLTSPNSPQHLRRSPLPSPVDARTSEPWKVGFSSQRFEPYQARSGPTSPTRRMFPASMPDSRPFPPPWTASTQPHRHTDPQASQSRRNSGSEISPGTAAHRRFTVESLATDRRPHFSDQSHSHHAIPPLPQHPSAAEVDSGLQRLPSIHSLLLDYEEPRGPAPVYPSMYRSGPSSGASGLPSPIPLSPLGYGHTQSPPYEGDGNGGYFRARPEPQRGGEGERNQQMVMQRFGGPRGPYSR